ncbi:MAG TPA: ferrochelatase [Xanthobacteraceae bacterium]|nr:ferrochelatase [Xanthobacteraceae bacterium]
MSDRPGPENGGETAVELPSAPVLLELAPWPKPIASAAPPAAPAAPAVDAASNATAAAAAPSGVPAISPLVPRPPPAIADTSAAAAPAAAAIGVLLVNLGTPDAPTPAAVRRYLKQFLTDRRVIEKDSLLWKFVLNCIILPLRSRRKARDYEKIWNREKDESPIKTITRSQAVKLAGILEPFGKHVMVDWAMRYASPSITSRLEAMLARGCERILVMPLYPQYSAATTATVCDEVYRFMTLKRRQPALRILPAYYDDIYYIEVLASSLKAELKGLSFTPDVIVASYHGMPKQYVLKGDPYESQCVRTTELLRQKLGVDDNKLIMTFQSRFGRDQWLEPYTIDTVKALAKKGVKNLVMVMPGFAADCLETLEEIAVDNARVFKRYGGANFATIPCLNDSEAGMLVIWQLAMRELKGWV